MKNLDSFYNKILLGNADKIAFGTLIIILIGFSYSIYFLFNRPVDTKVENRIKQESQSTNIDFDKDTIKLIIDSKDYGHSVNPVVAGKNPFIVY